MTCRFCGGDASEPNHRLHCDGRQGALEFDLIEARAARDEAVERVEVNAAPEFMETALAATYVVASRQPHLTTDDVWRTMHTMADAPTTHERRAMGPVMMRAKALGYVRPTASIEQSAMVVCHGRPKRVWLSLICRG